MQFLDASKLLQEQLRAERSNDTLVRTHDKLECNLLARVAAMPRWRTCRVVFGALKNKIIRAGNSVPHLK